MENFRSILKHLEFLRHKPLVIFRIISGAFRKNILRQNVLRTVDLAITGDCHYKCAFCSAYRMYKKGGPYLTVEQIKGIWKECVKLGVIHVNLTGGEPLLRDIDEICRIIRNFRPSSFLVSLVTNGIHLTEDKIRKLKDAGLDTLQLSIESINPQIHDDLVGIKGNFDKLMKCIQHAKDVGLKVCLNAVFFHGNAREIRELIDFSKEKGTFLVLNTASTEGKWRGINTNRLSKEDEKLFDEFMRFPHVRHDSSANFTGRRECPGGKERIHINAYGDVLTCPLVQISYGNVLKEPLKKIRSRMLNVALLKKYNRMCKHAFDEEYYKQALQPIEGHEDRPVYILDHPGLSAVKAEEKPVN